MSNERLNFDKNLETLQKLNFQLLYASTSKYEGDRAVLCHQRPGKIPGGRPADHG